MRLRFLIALIPALLPALTTAADVDLARRVGWNMTRLDLHVRVERDEPSLTVQGTMTLKLVDESSPGPVVWLNTREEAMKWLSVDGERVASVEFGSAEHLRESLRYAAVNLVDEASGGDEVTLTFEYEKVGGSGQLVTRPDVALASWVEGWYPVPLRDEASDDLFSAGLISVPGTTTLDLPGDWIAISDGRLVRREHAAGRTVEVWDLSGAPVARSFAAGPYTAAEREVGGRTIRIYLLKEHALGAEDLAELIASAMAAIEKRLGPFPFAGYGVVEVPDAIEGWGAASQQTFIMAKSNSFDYEHGNLPLWAHELSHGWWGNTVGTRGPGRKMAGEALAQLGVLIALETLEGTDAMVDFLEFSRAGYNGMQCARGYFELVRQGTDYPLATLDESDLTGGQTHNLADSKGMWVYHMLRRRVGDEVFFGTLRELASDFAGREMSLDDLRQTFVASAPDAGLERFFAQWLDRAGAPRIDAEMSGTRDDGVSITFRQTSEDDPFQLDLDVELLLDDGSVRRERVTVSDRETQVVFDLPTPVRVVRLDPDRDHLLWRDSYVMRPSVDGKMLPATADWVDPAVYAGNYHIAAFESDVEVFANGEGMWVKISEEDVRQLFPYEPHRFRTLRSNVDFTVDGGRATRFVVELDNGVKAEGVRVE